MTARDSAILLKFVSTFIMQLDLPHTPTSPLQLYEAVSTEVSNLWAYIQKRDIPGLKVEIRWKKQIYGTWCTVRWFPCLYCHCNGDSCDGKFVLKETTMLIKNDFSLEAFKHFVVSEKSWIENFCKD